MSNKKTKKAKKISLKTKLIVFAICFAIIGSLVFGAGVVFTGNDFGMTTLITHNTEKAYEDCLDADERLYNYTYFDMTVTLTQENLYDQSETQQVWDIQAIKNYDNTYNFIASASLDVGVLMDVTLYYQNGTLYRKHYFVENDVADKSSTIISNYSQAFSMYTVLFFPQLWEAIFPSSAAPIVAEEQFDSIQMSLLYSFPFSFGQHYEIAYQNNLSASYKIAYNGNVLQRTFSGVISQMVKETLNIEYHGVNNVFALNYPPDLNIY